MTSSYRPAYDQMLDALMRVVKTEYKSQREFAEELDVSTRYVSNVFTGRDTLSLDNLNYWAYVAGYQWKIELEPRR